MEINDQLIDKLEKLTKLKLASEERKIIKNDLGNILEMIDRIQELDTENVEPLQHINQDYNVLREDVAKNEINNEEALKNAPSTEGPYFSVPKVLNLKSKK